MRTGRVRMAGRIAAADVRALPPRLDPGPGGVHWRLPGAALGVLAADHARGATAYTVGTGPAWARGGLEWLMAALAAREHAFGPPCLSPDPPPGAENGGGGQTVLGSPCNSGGRLGLGEVVETCAGFGGAARSPTRSPA